MDELTESDVQRLIDEPSARREISARALADAFLQRLAASNPGLGAVLTITNDAAMEDADRADAARRRGQPLPLDGMPIVVKDNIAMGGYPTTAGSRPLVDNVPADDAEPLRRLRAAGAVVLGKAALHELAFGLTTQSEFFPSTRNPWDRSRVPGGSSGGCAAALAADLCVGAIGTDTGGSVRVPAALTGLTGLRPGPGVVPTTGVVAASPTFDTVGPMARSARDARLLLAALRTPGTPTASDGERFGPGVVAHLRVGHPGEEWLGELDREVAERTAELAELLARLGATIVRVSLPDFAPYAAPFVQVLRREGFVEHRARCGAGLDGLGRDVRQRLEYGRAVGEEELAAARQALRRWRAAAEAALRGLDLLLLPTTCVPAPPIGADDVTHNALGRLTTPLSVLHRPTVSIPGGLTRAGLPVGAQLTGRAGAEDALLAVAQRIEAETGFHHLRPPGRGVG